jgi:hypothetical protein
MAAVRYWFKSMLAAAALLAAVVSHTAQQCVASPDLRSAVSTRARSIDEAMVRACFLVFSAPLVRRAGTGDSALSGLRENCAAGQSSPTRISFIIASNG